MHIILFRFEQCGIQILYNVFPSFVAVVEFSICSKHLISSSDKHLSVLYLNNRCKGSQRAMNLEQHLFEL
jgi:hypothetical protein